jgi:hypothetical protein
VILPPHGVLSLGGHYRFRLAKRSATFRLQVVNVFDSQAVGYGGPGVYAFVAGRYVSGYFTVDI